MRQIVKRVKNGQEVKFICSTCGEVTYSMFILEGEGYEIDWDEIPEKCPCGAKLTNRQSIVDIANLDIGDTSENMCGDTNGNMRENVHGNMHENFHRNTYGNVSRNIQENSDVYRRCMSDLENAVSIDYFDMRLNGLKRGNFKIPNNIDHLRIECIKRNISYIELCIKSPFEKDECDSREIKERLNMLRQIYNDASRKYDDNQDFGKRH